MFYTALQIVHVPNFQKKSSKKSNLPVNVVFGHQYDSSMTSRVSPGAPSPLAEDTPMQLLPSLLQAGPCARKNSLPHWGFTHAHSF